MRTNTTFRLILSVFSIHVISATATAKTPATPNSLMCTPGELIFSEKFDPATVSKRWGFKAEFALRGGALLRTDVLVPLTRSARSKTRTNRLNLRSELPMA